MPTFTLTEFDDFLRQVDEMTQKAANQIRDFQQALLLKTPEAVVEDFQSRQLLRSIPDDAFLH